LTRGSNSGAASRSYAADPSRQSVDPKRAYPQKVGRRGNAVSRRGWCVRRRLSECLAIEQLDLTISSTRQTSDARAASVYLLTEI